MEVAGATALVTGAASGLGAATARRLAEGGAHVLLVDRNAALGRQLAEEIRGVFVDADVADDAAMEAAFAELANLRVLVCCAGIGLGRATVRSSGPHDLRSFEKVVRVNLTGTFNCVRLAAWHMAELAPLASGERGVIVTTSSIAAYDGVDGGVAYAASKAGVAGMTLPLARDLGRYAIRAVSIAPGSFATPLSAGLPAIYAAKMVDDSPFPARFGRAEEYAELVWHVIANPMLNGEVIRLDAGLRMAPSRLR